MTRAKKRVVPFIDLFSGAGGLAQGFRAASDKAVEFRPVLAVEIEPSFAASYAANFGNHVFTGPIESLRQEDVPSAELIIGGPPCQGFSPLGKMSPSDAHSEMNRLWRQYFRVIEWVQPLAFVIENVPQFLKSRQYASARRLGEKLGYRMVEGVLNASDFGVPQVRRRGFAIGLRTGVPRLPAIGPRAQRKTVRAAIGDLLGKPLVFNFDNGDGRSGSFTPHPVSALHIGRNPTPLSLERYRYIPEGGNRFDLLAQRPDLTPRCWIEKKTGSTDVMGRMEWDKPALTIRTEFFKPEKGRYLHPELHRPITHWEAARLQSFPDDFMFCGSKSDIARQIGNAVPPKLAEAVASTMKDLLQGLPASTATQEPESEVLELALS